jgi:DNA-binding MarR family transcriptional regulator
MRTQSRIDIDRAIRAYGRALTITDPVRLRFWDSRGLTMSQLRLMFLVLRRGQPTVGELADEMKVKPATVTGLTDRLVRQQLIERQADPTDRRVVRITLTSEGRRVLSELEAAGRAYLHEVLSRMDDEEVERVIAAFEAFADVAEQVIREQEQSS